MKTFYLPDLGEGLAEAEIRAWYIKAGDEVVVDQPLVSMETAKAVVDVPSPCKGKIVELHGNPNDIIKTGSPLITFETEDALQEKPKHSVVGALEESKEKWNEDHVVAGNAKSKSTTIKAMPAARVLAREMNIDLSLVTASGPQGLITPQDVKKYMEHSSSSQHLPNDKEVLTGVRRTMALAMIQSHREVVPVTIFDEANISNVPKETDITALLLLAMVDACKVEPALNAWFDGKALARKLFKEVNVGLAVNTQEGLFVPVIKDAQTKTAKDLRKIINEYKQTVNDRTIAVDKMQGATITLSNFGMVAGIYATPIVTVPTVAILGCGKMRPGRFLPLSLTFDHRAVTGVEATRFIGAVIKYIEAHNA